MKEVQPSVQTHRKTVEETTNHDHSGDHIRRESAQGSDQVHDGQAQENEEDKKTIETEDTNQTEQGATRE